LQTFLCSNFDGRHERVKNEIIEALQAVVKPSFAILMNNDGKKSPKSSLDSYVKKRFGTVPETFSYKKMAFIRGASLAWSKNRVGFYDHRETAQNHAEFLRR